MERVFDPGALQRLASAVRSAPQRPLLRLHVPASRSGFAARLAAAAREVSEGTDGAVALETEHGSLSEPVLTVEVGGRGAVHYRALPEGPEAAPFVEALLAMVQSEPRSGSVVARPTVVEVFIAPGCPNCPHAVRAATTLAAADALLTVTVVDVDAVPARARAMHVQSVPATIVDGGLTVVGVVSADELGERIVAAQGTDGIRVVLTSLLGAGRFDAAAHLLGEPGARLVFAELWRRSTMETRIGLLLTAEEALERDARCLDALAADLLPALQAVDVALRGDTVDLLGRIGAPVARADLELLTRDPVSDVAEAAVEALAACKGTGAVHEGDADEAEA
jgi:hypothetical protein